MFDESQLAAINSEAKKLLVLAGAGTGKTTMMLGRISKFVKDGIPADSILALTFTNAAASEMRDRYKQSAVTDTLPTFATFHAFCYRLIISDKYVADAIGYKTIPSVATDTDIQRIKTLCKQQCGTKLSDAKLNDPEKVSQKERFAYDVFWKQYRNMLRKENLITFDIMCGDICQLFHRNHSSIKKYKERYRCIFVDEFQDTDETQWRFVSSFKDSKITVVGDAKQNLYSFRGCSNEIIKNLTTDAEWVTIKLFRNYRSTKPICEYANKIHSRAWGDSPYNLMLEAQKDGHKIVWRYGFGRYDSRKQQDILDLTDGLYSGKSIAVLCRTNAEVAYVQAVMHDCGVRYEASNSHSIVPDIIKCAFDDTYFMNWIPTQMSSAEYTAYVKEAYVNPIYTEIKPFLDVYSRKLPKIVQPAITARAVAQSDLHIEEKAMRIADILNLRIRRLPEYVCNNHTLAQYLEAIYDAGETNGSVYVGTIHSVKGLEFDYVHIIGVESKYFKLSNEDNLNCYYVACTRAKEKLTIWMEDDKNGY